jgi:hypothetical protein
MRIFAMDKVEDFMRWLKESCGYIHPVEISGERYACINVRQNNTQILIGRIGDQTSWDNAW